MEGQSGFFARPHEQDGTQFIILGYNDPKSPENNLEAWFLPSRGCNLCRFSYGGERIIDADLARLAETGFPGNPVLYPTPNRVRRSRFVYKGCTFEQEKRGKKIALHGLVLDEQWQHDAPVVRDDGVSLRTWIDFEPESAMFAAFPIRHRLTMDYTLTASGVSMTYTVDNRDAQELPFGLGFHPFFSKLSGDDGTLVRVPATRVMDYTSDLLPTGRMIDVDGTIYDLRQEFHVGKKELGHVFTDLIPGEAATVRYSKQGILMRLIATEDFTHIVYYSPRGSDIFCIENQTCSTDAHNLNDQGFTREAHLLVVQPGEKLSGTVTFAVEHI